MTNSDPLKNAPRQQLNLNVLGQPDSVDVDATLLDSLVRLDESLRAGHVPSDDAAPTDLTEIQREFWQAGKECLRQLHSLQVRPQIPGMPAKVGRFELERVLGHGGFAVVYLAWDPYLRRRAAVKIPRPHVLESPGLRQRFLREAQTVSQLDHPHVVATYEAGEDSGLPYIAHAYCEGPTLAAWLQAQTAPVPARRAAELVRALSDAVQYSHSHGILHRDIKPGNVLLFPIRDVLEGELPYIARLSDFGLAKLIEADLQDTATSMLMGTPRYMAPEQTTGKGAAVGPATDVYGLGAVLYEVLTNQPPFTAATAWDTLTQVRDYLPAAPRLLRPQIPRDLETICMTCLAKDPAERYASAGLLASDLTRFLEGRPVLAQPISLPFRAWRWCRRNRIVAGSTAALMSAGLLLICGLIFHLRSVQELGRDLGDRNIQLAKSVKQLDEAAVRSRQLERLAAKNASELLKTLYAVEMKQAAQAWRKGDVHAALTALRAFSENRPEVGDLREFTWRYLFNQMETRDTARITLPAAMYSVKYSPASDLVACAGADSVIRLYSTRDHTLRKEIPTSQREINGLAFGPHGAWLASVGDDGTAAIWDLPDGRLRRRWPVFTDKLAYQVVYSEPLGLLVVCGNHPDIFLFDIATGESRGALTGVHIGGVEAISLSRDGRRLLSCGANQVVVLWELESRQQLHTLVASEKYVSAGDWTDDDRGVAAAEVNGQVRVWNSTTGEEKSNHYMLDSPHSLVFGPAGHLIVGDSSGKMLMFRLTRTSQGDPGSLTPPVYWAPHRGRIYGMDFTSDGQSLASVATDKRLVVQKLRARDPVKRRHTDMGRRDYFQSRTVGPDGWGRTYRLTTEGVIVMPGGSFEQRRIIENTETVCTLILHGNDLLAGDRKGQFYRWSLSPNFEPPKVTRLAAESAAIRIIPLDEQRVLLQFVGQPLVLWNLRRNQPDIFDPAKRYASVSPHGGLVAFTSTNPGEKTLSLCESNSLICLRKTTFHMEDVLVVAFGPDNRRVFTGSSDRSIRVLDTDTLAEVFRLEGHNEVIASLAVAPDGATLASADEGGSIRLWDLRSGRELIELIKHHEPFQGLKFSPDGSELLATDARFEEFLWSTRDDSPPDTSAGQQ